MRERPEVLHLSLVVGGALVGRAGGRLGRVDDLVVRLEEQGYPPVTGALASVAGRPVFVPGDALAELAHGRVELTTDRLDLRPFERRPQEVLLRKDVLDRQLIDVDGARLRRANDIELARLEGWWRVVGVDVGPRGILRRVAPRRLAGHVGEDRILDWSDVEPFTGHVPTVRLRVPHPKLARLHPAELADLIEAAGHAEGEEILAAVHDDPELEADLFEELDSTRAREFLDERRMPRPPRSSRAWRATMQRTRCSSSTKSAVRASSSFCPTCSAGGSRRFSATRPRQPVG